MSIEAVCYSFIACVDEYSAFNLANYRLPGTGNMLIIGVT